MKRANPTAIGLFVLGALVLAVVGVVTFASDTAFQQKSTFVSYFDESVNGLDVGAPVKFKGVPIGRVTEIQVRMDLGENTFQVPVIYEINLDPLTNEVGTPVDLSNRRVLREQVDEGLRAQLQMESFLTGKLYVELTFVANGEPVPSPPRRAPHLVIPSTLSPLAQIGEEASGLVANLRAFDVGTINENLVTLLVKANQKIDALDVEGINASLVRATESVEELAQSPEIRDALRDVPEATQQLTATLAEAQAVLKRLDAAIDPTTESVTATSDELVATLREMRTTMEQTRVLLSPDAGMGYHMEDALVNLSEAAEALRVLAVELERNPSMFIRGKDEDDPDAASIN